MLRSFPSYILTLACLSIVSLPLEGKQATPPATTTPIELQKEKQLPNPCECSPTMFSKAFTKVAKEAMPAVVFIRVESAAPQAPVGSYGNPFGGGNPFPQFGDDFFNRFFGFPPQAQPPKPAPQVGQGSGFFVNSDGYIMTNSHVVKGADKITVGFTDGRELDATLVGTDPDTDIAIIKVEGKDFPYLDFGDSEQIEVAEWVIAIGSPFQLEASVTVGVVSAKGRQNLKINNFEDFIQTDAAINPGNSGGPLLNLSGDVIGINTAIFTRNGGYMGIGFAIPSNMAKHIMKQIIDTGSVTRGFLGITLQPIDKDLADAFKLSKPEGVLISEILKDSPADKAGLKQGDIIIEYNKIPVKSLSSFRNDISMILPGTKVDFKVNRKGKILTIPVVIGSASDTNAAASGVASKLGIEVDKLTADTAQQLGYPITEEGVVITKVKPGSPAAMVGIRPGFLVLAINHKKVTTVEEFNEALKSAADEKQVLLLVRQGNMTRFYPFKLE